MLELPHDLGDGLLLRRGTQGDTAALAEFNGEIFRHPDGAGADVGMNAWTMDLMSGRHPTFSPGDYLLVEDIRGGRIVSSLNIIGQTWTYDGIPFGVGRFEQVGTHPDYRKRGLVRRQMEVAHAWSAARGDLVQAISGIPGFYRQFGYGMAVHLWGNRAGFASAVPRLKPGESEPYRLRPAGEADIPLLMRLYDQFCAAWLLACPRDATRWRYELFGKSPASLQRRVVLVIEATDDSTGPVGMIAHLAQVTNQALGCTLFELLPGNSYLAVAPSVIRYLVTAGRNMAAPGEELIYYWFDLGPAHPGYEAMRSWLPKINEPGAWYLRVPDVPAFLRRIAPVLERRLAGSPAAGHTGALRLNFYRTGVRLAFERGRITVIEPWQPPEAMAGEAGMTDQTFVQLLFGDAAVDTLYTTVPDFYYQGDTGRVLLRSLFPRRPSYLWPID